MSELTTFNTDGLTAEDMVFVSYSGELGGENGVSICHYSILNFSDCEIKQFETEEEAKVEFLMAVKAGWTPRGSFSSQVLNGLL